MPILKTVSRSEFVLTRGSLSHQTLAANSMDVHPKIDGKLYSLDSSPALKRSRALLFRIHHVLLKPIPPVIFL